MARVRDPHAYYDRCRAELDYTQFLPEPPAKSHQRFHLMYLREQVAFYERNPGAAPFRRDPPGIITHDAGSTP